MLKMGRHCWLVNGWIISWNSHRFQLWYEQIQHITAKPAGSPWTNSWRHLPSFCEDRIPDTALDSAVMWAKYTESQLNQKKVQEHLDSAPGIWGQPQGTEALKAMHSKNHKTQASDQVRDTQAKCTSSQCKMGTTKMRGQTFVIPKKTVIWIRETFHSLFGTTKVRRIDSWSEGSL